MNSKRVDISIIHELKQEEKMFSTSLLKNVCLGQAALVLLVILSVNTDYLASAMVVPSGSSEKISSSSELDPIYDSALIERLDEIKNLINQADIESWPLDEQNGFDYDGNAARNHLSERHIGKETKVR